MVHLTFENPLYLILLLLIPVLIFLHFFLLKHSREKALRFANFETLKGVTGNKTITKNIPLLVIRMMVLTAVIIAASGMVMWYETDVNENDFVIAIDVSPSMSAQDIKPSRIGVAKQVSEWLINNSKTSNIGVVSFSGITFVDSTLITNKNSLRKTIKNIDIMKVGGTDISGAIITSTNLLLNSDKTRVIVLIGDGSDTASAFMEKGIEESIDYAKNHHVMVHTVGIGSESGPAGYLPTEYNLTTVYNEETLKQISNSTEGEFFKISSLNEFKQMYGVDQPTEKGIVPFRLDRNLIIIALVLLFIEWGLINTKFRKIP